MERYAYSLLGLYFLGWWLAAYISRRDLRHLLLRTGVIGAVAGILSEYWHLKDYWHPPTIIIGFTVPEDMLAGFAVAGFSAVLFNMFFQREEEYRVPPRLFLFLIFFLLGVGGMLLFVNTLGFNSIVTSSLLFLLFACTMVWMRRDLLWPALATGLLLTLIAIPLYFVLFGLFAEHWWEHTWLLQEKRLGVILWKGTPATELLWYFSWGCLAGVLPGFVRGTEKRLR